MRRSGSGSASRSVLGGYVEWPADDPVEDPEGDPGDDEGHARTDHPGEEGERTQGKNRGQFTRSARYGRVSR